MAKLSKYFLGAFALGFCDAAVNYETVSCNNDENVSLHLEILSMQRPIQFGLTILEILIHISFNFLFNLISEGRIDFSTRENLFRVEFSRATNGLRAEKRFLCENRPRSRPYCCLR